VLCETEPRNNFTGGSADGGRRSVSQPCGSSVRVGDRTRTFQLKHGPQVTLTAVASVELRVLRNRTMTGRREADEYRFMAAVVLAGCPELRQAVAASDGDPVDALLAAFDRKKLPGNIVRMAEAVFELSGFPPEPAGTPPVGVSERRWVALHRAYHPLPAVFCNTGACQVE
jgi:hypothetical protein